jgi:hypothetical protein
VSAIDRARAGRGLVSNRIAAVPFTLRNIREDLEDVGSNYDGGPDLEFRVASKALELERSGLSYQWIPPDYRFPYGHTHKEQEDPRVRRAQSRRESARRRRRSAGLVGRLTAVRASPIA